VAGIVGLGQALLGVGERLTTMRSIAPLRDRLETELCRRLPETRVHGAGAQRAPNTSCLAFAGIDAGALLVNLDLAGLCVSRGAACASGAEEPSHVLTAMGVPREWALATLRLSLGVETTAAEIDEAIELVVAGVERQRAGSPEGDQRAT
jgi:cysteine desulfurase